MPSNNRPLFKSVFNTKKGRVPIRTQPFQNYNSTLQMLDSRNSQSSTGGYDNGQQASNSAPQAQPPIANDTAANNFSEELDDDIPF